MIAKSIKGLLKKERTILKEVEDLHEPDANAYEIKIEELCTSLIAQYRTKGKGLKNSPHDLQDDQ